MSNTRKVIKASRYVSFQDELDDSSFERSGDELEDVINAKTSPTSDIELFENGVISSSTSRRDNNSENGDHILLPKRVRLRAVESEREYFLKLMNVSLFKKLSYTQAVASVIIIISQVVLYAIVTRQSFKVVDIVGIGVWAPLIFFSVACCLTILSTRSPSGCSVGTAMGFQIASIFIGCILIIIATIALVQHGQYNYWSFDKERTYDPEITGRIFCSLMIISACLVTIVALVLSIMFCRVTCCAKSHAHETVVFDVETIKP